MAVTRSSAQDAHIKCSWEILILRNNFNIQLLWKRELLKNCNISMASSVGLKYFTEILFIAPG